MYIYKYQYIYIYLFTYILKNYIYIYIYIYIHIYIYVCIHDIRLMIQIHTYTPCECKKIQSPPDLGPALIHHLGASKWWLRQTNAATVPGWEIQQNSAGCDQQKCQFSSSLVLRWKNIAHQEVALPCWNYFLSTDVRGVWDLTTSEAFISIRGLFWYVLPCKRHCRS